MSSDALILINLVLTIALYGAGPILKLRKTNRPVTLKSLRRFSIAYTVIIWLGLRLLAAWFDLDAASFNMTNYVPAVLWGTIFYKHVKRKLQKKELLDTSNNAPKAKPQKPEPYQPPYTAEEMIALTHRRPLPNTPPPPCADPSEDQPGEEAVSTPNTPPEDSKPSPVAGKNSHPPKPAIKLKPINQPAVAPPASDAPAAAAKAKGVWPVLFVLMALVSAASICFALIQTSRLSTMNKQYIADLQIIRSELVLLQEANSRISIPVSEESESSDTSQDISSRIQAAREKEAERQIAAQARTAAQAIQKIDSRLQEISSDNDEEKNHAAYVANISGSKYHLLSCKYAGNIAEEKLVYYATSDEAKAAGKSPCSFCLP